MIVGSDASAVPSEQRPKSDSKRQSFASISAGTSEPFVSAPSSAKTETASDMQVDSAPAVPEVFHILSASSVHPCPQNSASAHKKQKLDASEPGKLAFRIDGKRASKKDDDEAGVCVPRERRTQPHREA